jgi:hypothetical protein
MRAQNAARKRRPGLSLVGRRLVTLMLRDRKFRRAARREITEAGRLWWWNDLRRFLRYA